MSACAILRDAAAVPPLGLKIGAAWGLTLIEAGQCGAGWGEAERGAARQAQGILCAVLVKPVPGHRWLAGALDGTLARQCHRQLPAGCLQAPSVADLLTRSA